LLVLLVLPDKTTPNGGENIGLAENTRWFNDPTRPKKRIY
jgi:hypothetical protein